VLLVTTWPRVWSSVKQGFVADKDTDSNGSITHELKLEPWEPAQPSAQKPAATQLSPTQVVEMVRAEKPAVQLTKNLLYRFYRLPYHVRVEIALELDLIRDEDEQVPDNDRFDKILQRAADSNLIAELQAAIETRERGHK